DIRLIGRNLDRLYCFHFFYCLNRVFYQVVSLKLDRVSGFLFNLIPQFLKLRIKIYLLVQLKRSTVILIDDAVLENVFFHDVRNGAFYVLKFRVHHKLESSGVRIELWLYIAEIVYI